MIYRFRYRFHEEVDLVRVGLENDQETLSVTFCDYGIISSMNEWVLCGKNLLYTTTSVEQRITKSGINLIISRRGEASGLFERKIARDFWKRLVEMGFEEKT